MDRKSILILVLSFGLLMLWPVVVGHFFPPTPLPPGATNAAPGAVTGTNQLSQAKLGTNAPPVMSAAPTTVAPLPARAAAGPEQLETIQTTNQIITFTSRGGGIKQIELKEYPETIARSKSDTSTNGATLNQSASMPILALTGNAALEDDGVYKLSRTATGVRAEKQLANGLLVVKEFTPSSNYLMNVTVRLENRSGKEQVVPSQQLVIGTSTLINTNDDPLQLGMFVSANGSMSKVDATWFANRSFGGCGPGNPRSQFQSATPVNWAAVHNRFFVMALVPQDKTAQAAGYPVDLPTITSSGPTKGVEGTLLYPATPLSASGTNSAVQHSFTLYAGPREYNGLAKIAKDMNNDLDQIMDFGGFFGFFSKALLLSMNGLHDLMHLPYGLCIVAITIIIKLIFWPLTQASTRSMKRMSTLQPQMKAIQEKYKDDPQKMNRKMMEFMKENRVNPMGGCLPMLIQIPVFFGFYYMIRSAIELRGAGFLWAFDLSQPDTIAMIAGFPINPLPLVMGATMFWQAQLTPPSPGMDPTQQKIMKYMPLMFLFMLYKMSAGLTLYWTMQNILTIIQTKLTRTTDAPAASAAPAHAVHRKGK